MRPDFKIFVPAALLPAFALLIGCSSPGTHNSVIPSFSMGERAQTGPLIYNVFDTKWQTQLGAGMSARVPANRFFLIRLSVVNSSSSEVMVPALTITDDNGQSYAELSNGEDVPQWMGYLRRIKPSETLIGHVIFDAPPRHYKLQVADESEEKKAFIDIPLSFSAEAPNDTYLPPKPKTDN